VTGKGSIWESEPDPAGTLDGTLLRLVVECMEAWSKENRPTAEKKVEIIIKVYGFFASEPEKADRGKVLALVRTAA
jgi:hypothetical protein